MTPRILVGFAIAARLALALDYTFVPVPGNANIETQLISTIPTGTFTANNTLATPFSIPATPGKCGTSGNAPCNAYIGQLGNGQSLTLNVSVPNATDVYTLMNASSPPPGAQLFTITFIGSQGATLTFPLIAGADIRDYAQGIFANTLTNGISGVQALNAFSCVDPATCLGSGGSGNVLTGEKATYVADEQHFSLGTAFIGQTLTQIVLTDTYGGKPQLLLMGATVGSLGAPSITSGGVVPIDSPVNTIESGSWISIYGTNLAAASATWNGDFPIMLGGTSVTIGNRPAYLWYVSPTQINVQVPGDSALGPVNVTVTTPVGSSTSTATLAAYAPSFSLFTAKYPAAIVMTPGSPGNSGAGYDIIGPSGAFSFPSRPVKPGEILILFGVGFGPTNPTVPAGELFSGAAPSITDPQILIGNMPATVQFAGIIEAGLFQFNIVVPNAPSGDQILTANIAGVSTQPGVTITLQ
jgi:uncharacterized protein (TIGR03437 family)